LLGQRRAPRTCARASRRPAPRLLGPEFC